MKKTIQFYQKMRQLKDWMTIIEKGSKTSVGKLLYYARSEDPTMIMKMKSLAALKTKPTIETAKQVPRF